MGWPTLFYIQSGWTGQHYIYFHWQWAGQYENHDHSRWAGQHYSISSLDGLANIISTFTGNELASIKIMTILDGLANIILYPLHMDWPTLYFHWQWGQSENHDHSRWTGQHHSTFILCELAKPKDHRNP
jgi:hypothetical protein